MAAQNKQMKRDIKAAKLLEEEELRVLIGEGLLGNTAEINKSAAAEALGLTEVSEEVQALLDGFQ